MYHGGGGGGGGKEDSKVLYTQLHLTYLPTSQHTSHVHRPDAKQARDDVQGADNGRHDEEQLGELESTEHPHPATQ